MQPFNYNIDLKNPFNEAIHTGIAMRQAADNSNVVQQTLADNVLKRQEELLAAQRKNKEADEQAAYVQGMFNQPGGPTVANFAYLQTRFPGTNKQVVDTYNMLDSAKQRDRLNLAATLLPAVKTGQMDIAKRIVSERLEAAKNSGNTEEIDAMTNLQHSLNQGQPAALMALGMGVSAIMGGDKFVRTFGELDKQDIEKNKLAAETNRLNADTGNLNAQANLTQVQAEVLPAKTESGILVDRANVANIQSIIDDRSVRQDLDKEKLTQDTALKYAEINQKYNISNLDPGSRKLVNESVVEQGVLSQKAAKAEDLSKRWAAEYAKSGVGKGWLFGGTAEWLAKAFGTQDGVSKLRSEYNEIKNTFIDLPPGSASDKDVAIFMAGFPPDHADGAYIASWLAGRAKTLRMGATVAGARSSYIPSNGHLGTARRDMVIDGVEVKKGSTFKDFTNTLLTPSGDSPMPGDTDPTANNAPVRAKSNASNTAPKTPRYGKD